MGRAASAKGIRFTAVLGRVGVIRCVDVPAEVSERLARRAEPPASTRIAVDADVLGATFTTTLVPRGGGLHRLFVPAAVCREAGFSPGDEIPVVVRLAGAPGPDPILPLLERVCRGDPDVLMAYSRLSPSDRRQIARYIDSAKSPDTRARRLETIVSRLRERAART